jgi:hypothetical protein
MDAQTGWIYRYHTLFEDAEYRLVICEYEAIAEPDLYIEYTDEDGDWCAQVPLPIDGERARAIAAGLVAWADSQVEPPAPNRFDSVEVSGLVEPIGVITDGPK